MWITDQDIDLEREMRPTGAVLSRGGDAEPQCECPDFCPVQHDDN